MVRIRYAVMFRLLAAILVADRQIDQRERDRAADDLDDRLGPARAAGA